MDNPEITTPEAEHLLESKEKKRWRASGPDGVEFIANSLEELQEELRRSREK